MKLLVDENLSPRVAELLADSGHDAVHVRDVQASSAPDSTIMKLAEASDRVILSADTDFGALLAQARTTKPSIILVREIAGLRPPELARIVIEQLDQLESHLQQGAIAAITRGGIRVRALPLR